MRNTHYTPNNNNQFASIPNFSLPFKARFTPKLPKCLHSDSRACGIFLSMTQEQIVDGSPVHHATYLANFDKWIKILKTKCSNLESIHPITPIYVIHSNMILFTGY